MFFVNFITMLYLKCQIQKDREETYTVNTIHRKSPMLTGYEYVENIDISFSYIIGNILSNCFGFWMYFGFHKILGKFLCFLVVINY